MNECICCSGQLLRHIRHQQIYWYCSRCRQDMPVVDENLTNLNQEFSIRNALDIFLGQDFSQQILMTAE